MTQTMLDLAERVAKAEGPDLELAEAVLRAVGWHVDAYSQAIKPNGERAFRIPDPLFSIDDAYALAPEGWYLRVEPRFYSDEGEVLWRAYAIKPDWSRWTPHDDWFEVIGEDDRIIAATPALALCAAAFRARSVSHSGEE